MMKLLCVATLLAVAHGTPQDPCCGGGSCGQASSACGPTAVTMAPFTFPTHNFPTLPTHTFPPHSFPTFGTFGTLPPHTFPTLPPHSFPTMAPGQTFTLGTLAPMFGGQNLFGTPAPAVMNQQSDPNCGFATTPSADCGNNVNNMNNMNNMNMNGMAPQQPAPQMPAVPAPQPGNLNQNGLAPMIAQPEMPPAPIPQQGNLVAPQTSFVGPEGQAGPLLQPYPEQVQVAQPQPTLAPEQYAQQGNDYDINEGLSTGVRGRRRAAAAKTEKTDSPLTVREIEASEKLEGLDEKLREEAKMAEKVEERVLSQKCNDERLRKIIMENVDKNPSASKRKIQKAAATEIGGLFDVVCSQHDFSYLANTQLFCEAGNEDVTCFAFLHSILP